ncbi:MAG: hypothetical protein FOGNACKC_02987 [Anaerolineae bacterium]|nr:hypothetical protein [Anaerolineae bacterium]
MQQKRLYFPLLIVLLSLLLWPLAALAQDKTLVWNRYDVNITAQQNGDMQVEEIQEIQFTSGTFRFGFAAIPLDRVERITDVSMAEIMPDGSLRQYAPNSTAEYGFTSAVNEGNLEITWYFPPTANSRHTYALRYRVEGGMRIYPDGDQVWWKAIPPDHNFPIRSATITVTPPATFSKNQLVVDAYGHPIDGASYTDRGAVVFTASNIAADEELEVRVQFPHGAVQAEPPAWQASDDLRRQWGPVVGVLMGVLGLAVLIGGPVGVYLLWYTRGRDDSVLAPEYVSEPPGDLPAGVVGTLVDEHADLKDIMASLFDLAQRGAIRMEEKQNTGTFGMSRDFIFHLQDASLARYPHEEYLLKRLFGNDRTERRLQDLREKFYTAISPLKKELYQELVRQGFFPASPERTRQKWLGLAVLGMVVSFISACGLLILLGDFSPAAICPGLGLLASMVMLLVVGRHMPRKTPKGAEEAAKWLAFKKYLQNINEYADLDGVKEKFQEYLPYAIAFGLEKRLIKQFSAVDAPAPTWWGPVFVPYGGYHGPHHHRPTGGGSMTAAGGPPGPLAGAGGGVPNLSEMSGSLGSSLSSMSAGLGSLLNSASSTLTSTPPPPASSSSSGGWGGGGWSGGGGFGGGGGGGGSRGFG